MNKDKLDSALETVNELHGETLKKLDDDALIEVMARAMCDLYYTHEEADGEWESYIFEAKAALAVCRPIIEAQTRERILKDMTAQTAFRVMEEQRQDIEKYKTIASKAIREQIDVREDEKNYNKIKSWEEDGWGCTLDEALQMWSPGDVRELPPSGTVNLIKHALAEIKRIRAENERLRDMLLRSDKLTRQEWYDMRNTQLAEEANAAALKEAGNEQERI